MLHQWSCYADSFRLFFLISNIDTIGTNVLLPDIKKTVNRKSENAGQVSVVGDLVAEYSSGPFAV
jgi:hypothetical protein